MGVNKTGEFGKLSRIKVSVKLVALVPGIVELIAHCACYLQERVRPGVPPDHCEIEIVETIKSATSFVPALWGECIVRKLKACVERVHVCVHSRVSKVGLVVNILLEHTKLCGLLFL